MLGGGAAALLAARAAPVPPAHTTPPPPPRPPAPRRRGNRLYAEPVGRVTGQHSPNRTGESAAVYGTDLGISWADGSGGVLVAFGDTFGRGWSGAGGAAGPGATPAEADWRSNVLARSAGSTLAAGMRLDSWLTDRPGHARQVIPRDERPGVREFTVIPTAGISVGRRNFMAYMSVRGWGAPGRWRTNYAGIAYSDDVGETWHKPDAVRWANLPDGSQGWQMCAFARDGGFVYIFGTPNGRAGPVRLARVPEDAVLDLGAREQWTGAGWTRDQSRAAVVIPAPASELSVMFHWASGRWLAAHYHERLDAIVVHTASRVTGPWSPPHVVATAADWPALYGAFFHPFSAMDDTPYFQMSQWWPYNTMLMRLHLEA
ncbi:DUF4185 domain-containing protein [Pseudonocardia sp. K10HN5]|uniref:DUF4185 domain-containing protein n=2 Tax=Pseudonocardia acidicola TaxID=2724939 RepID=A0ABX1SNN0_9PSEU|nr:DUF4185 domain-containing protein [Pseudonocardia acidicola]NMI02208.1 DUF4185 domain-containing protein [Pseudonocardia acidicola]